MSGGARGRLIPPAAAGGGYDSSGKSPAEIEEDIVETRAELGELLDALERKLAPRQLLERGIDMVKDTVSGEGGGLRDTLRNHPLPLALIGMGIGWILMSPGTRTRIGEYGGAVKDRVSGALHEAGEKAGELAGQVRDKVARARAPEAAATTPYPTEMAGYAYARQKSDEAMEKARAAAGKAQSTLQDNVERAQQAGKTAWRRAGRYAEDAGQRLSQAGDRFTELMESHPLAVGALGFLAGAVAALLLPRSEIEERLVGPVGEELREKAASVGREAVERAQHVAERAIDTAAGAVKDAVSETAEAVQAKAEEASFGIGEPGKT